MRSEFHFCGQAVSYGTQLRLETSHVPEGIDTTGAGTSPETYRIQDADYPSNATRRTRSLRQAAIKNAATKR